MATYANVVNRFLSAYPDAEQQDVNMPVLLLNRADIYVLQFLPLRWKTFTISNVAANVRTYAIDPTVVKIENVRYFQGVGQYQTLLASNLESWNREYDGWRTLNADYPYEYAVQPNETASSIWLLGLPSSSTLQVTGATNATPIVVTTGSAHGLSDGSQVQIQGVTGNTAANGTFYVDVLSGTTFALYSDSGLTVPVAGSGAYVSGGYVLANGSPIIEYDARYTTSLTASSNMPDFPFLEELYIQKMCELYASDQRDWESAREHKKMFDDMMPEAFALLSGKAEGQFTDIRSFQQVAGWGSFRSNRGRIW